MRFLPSVLLGLTTLVGMSPAALAVGLCEGFGPQAPRDISMTAGTNPLSFTPAPAASTLNLCNIHTHTNAEHKGPGFSISAGDGEHGGYRCNESAEMRPTAAAEPEAAHADGAAAEHSGFQGVKPGDTIEVHWVYTSCAAAPGKGLGACVTKACANPQIRVESQVFLVVDDPSALKFSSFDYSGGKTNGLHQPRSLPLGTGDPVVFAGSTTGPSFSEEICSPFQVTWSVRPRCARLDINSLNAWANGGNVFKENHSHGVRQLVTAPELLSPIN